MLSWDMCYVKLHRCQEVHSQFEGWNILETTRRGCIGRNCVFLNYHDVVASNVKCLRHESLNHMATHLKSVTLPTQHYQNLNITQDISSGIINNRHGAFRPSSILAIRRLLFQVRPSIRLSHRLNHLLSPQRALTPTHGVLHLLPLNRTPHFPARALHPGNQAHNYRPKRQIIRAPSTRHGHHDHHQQRPHKLQPLR